MSYATIREHIGYLIGKKVVDISQHDETDWEEGDPGFVMLMFEDGSWVKFLLNGEPGKTDFEHFKVTDPDVMSSNITIAIHMVLTEIRAFS